MEKFVTSPRMLASAGHDRYGLLLAKHFADDPDMGITMLNLKPDIALGLEAVAWCTVENGKQKLSASHGSQKSIMTRLAGSIIDKFAGTVRNSD